MQKLTIVLLSLILPIAVYAQSSINQSNANQGNTHLSTVGQSCVMYMGTCEYYQCLEVHENCGADEYYIDFGYKYCEKYKKKQPKFTEHGQVFLNNVRMCLQEVLQNEVDTKNQLPVCSKVKKFAVESHKYCYQVADYCSLSAADKFRVKWIAKTEILDVQMLKFAAFLETMCL